MATADRTDVVGGMQRKGAAIVRCRYHEIY